jgi:hypothetical protein
MLKTVLAGVLIFGAQVVTADWPQCQSNFEQSESD